MTKEQVEAGHQQSLQLLNGVEMILAEHPGSKLEHKQRENTVRFLRERIEEWKDLQLAQVVSEEPKTEVAS